MQSAEPGAQSFQPIRPVRQTDTHEVWDVRLSDGHPATVVLLPAPAAGTKFLRVSFGGAVTWALQPDVREVVVLAWDVTSTVPWILLAPDPHGHAADGFILHWQAPDIDGNSPTVHYGSPAPMAVPPQAWPAEPLTGPAPPPPFAPPPADGSPAPRPQAPPAPRPQHTDPPGTAAPPAAGPAAGPATTSWEAAPALPLPQGGSRAPLLVGLVAAAVLVLAAVAAAVLFALPRIVDRSGGRQPTAPLASSAMDPRGAPRPTFRASAAPVTVLGEPWQPGDRTTIQAFDGWPFAFRTPAEATCQFWVGDPDYRADNCRWGAEPQHTVMAFVVRRCTNGCDPAERARFTTLTPWKPDAVLTARGDDTMFGEVNYGSGRAQLTMLHYFRTASDGPPQWVVIAQGNYPAPQREQVLKTINDIRSQTG